MRSDYKETLREEHRLKISASGRKGASEKSYDNWLVKKDIDRAIAILNQLSPDRAADHWIPVTTSLCAIERLAQIKFAPSDSSDASDDWSVTSKHLIAEWRKWTIKHHRFESITLTRDESMMFSAGFRELLIPSSSDAFKLSSLKWIVTPILKNSSARPKPLSSDETLQNKLFLRECQRSWLSCKELMRSQLLQSIQTKLNTDTDPSQVESACLNDLGIPQLQAWVEQDEETYRKQIKADADSKRFDAERAHKHFMDKSMEIKDVPINVCSSASFSFSRGKPSNSIRHLSSSSKQHQTNDNDTNNLSRSMQSPIQYSSWLSDQASKESALKCLSLIPCPNQMMKKLLSINNDQGITSIAFQHWIIIGKALKSIHASFQSNWLTWSQLDVNNNNNNISFLPVRGLSINRACNIVWDFIEPKGCDVHSHPSAISSILKTLSSSRSSSSRSTMTRRQVMKQINSNGIELTTSQIDLLFDAYNCKKSIRLEGEECIDLNQLTCAWSSCCPITGLSPCLTYRSSSCLSDAGSSLSIESRSLFQLYDLCEGDCVLQELIFSGMCHASTHRASAAGANRIRIIQEVPDWRNRLVLLKIIGLIFTPCQLVQVKMSDDNWQLGVIDRVVVNGGNDCSSVSYNLTLASSATTSITGLDGSKIRLPLDAGSTLTSMVNSKRRWLAMQWLMRLLDEFYYKVGDFLLLLLLQSNNDDDDIWVIGQVSSVSFTSNSKEEELNEGDLLDQFVSLLWPKLESLSSSSTHHHHHMSSPLDNVVLTVSAMGTSRRVKLMDVRRYFSCGDQVEVTCDDDVYKSGVVTQVKSSINNNNKQDGNRFDNGVALYKIQLDDDSIEVYKLSNSIRRRRRDVYTKKELNQCVMSLEKKKKKKMMSDNYDEDEFDTLTDENNNNNPPFPVESFGSSYTCTASSWSSTHTSQSLNVLTRLSQAGRDKIVISDQLSRGRKPSLPVVRQVIDGDELTSSVQLNWCPGDGSDIVSFYCIELSLLQSSNNVDDDDRILFNDDDDDNVSYSSSRSTSHVSRKSLSSKSNNRSNRSNSYKEILRDPTSSDQPLMLTHTIRQLSPDQSFSVRVRAYNGFGCSDWTYLDCFTCPARPHVPIVCRILSNEVMLKCPVNMIASQDKLAALKKWFVDLDDDGGNGEISRDELERGLTRFHDLREFLKSKLSKTDGDDWVGLMFDQMETDDDKGITWNEFERFFMNLGWDDASVSTGKTSKKKKKMMMLRYVVEKCVNQEENQFETLLESLSTDILIRNLKPASSYCLRIRVYNLFVIDSFMRVNPSADRQSVMKNWMSEPSETVILHTLLIQPPIPRIMSCCSISRTAGSDTNTIIVADVSWIDAIEIEKSCLDNCESAMSYMCDLNDKISKLMNDDEKKKKTKRIDVQTATAINSWMQNKNKETSSSVNIDRVFSRYDVDRNQTMDVNELGLFLRDLGIEPTTSKIQDVLSCSDTDKSNTLSLSEFKGWWTSGQVSFVLKRSDPINGASHLLQLEQKQEFNIDLTSLASLKSWLIGQIRMTTVVSKCSGFDSACKRVSGLYPNCVYAFAVRCNCSYTYSPLSSPIIFMTPSLPPTNISITRTQSTSTSLCVRWCPPQFGADKYIIMLALTAKEEGDDGDDASWQTVFEGSDLMWITTAPVHRLIPSRKKNGTVLQLRMLSMNRFGIASEPSRSILVNSFSSSSSSSDSSIARRMINRFPDRMEFLIECTDDVTLGDTILFSDRIYNQTPVTRPSSVSKQSQDKPVHRLSVSSSTSSESFSRALSAAAAAGIPSSVLTSMIIPPSKRVEIDDRKLNESVNISSVHVDCIGERSIVAHVVHDNTRSLLSQELLNGKTVHSLDEDGLSEVIAKCSNKRQLRLEIVNCSIMWFEKAASKDDESNYKCGQVIVEKWSDVCSNGFDIFRKPWATREFEQGRLGYATETLNMARAMVFGDNK